MEGKSDFDFLTEEVKELLINYKNKKATAYEPCTPKNVVECLIGLREELGLLNINYIFNPYVDLKKDQLTAEALVNLINATWTLLYYQKNSAEQTERLMEQNHTLKQNNKQLNALVSRLDLKVSSKSNEARACVASAQKTLDRSDQLLHNFSQTKAQLLQVTKQKEAMDRNYKTEVSRLQKENEKLINRLQNKSGSFTPCSNVCDDSILKLKERERKQRVVISQLQTNNQDLLRDLLALKEDLLQ